MGQRSQIYVRYNGELIIASYYQWNYDERMISRARYGIEYIINNYLSDNINFVFHSEHYLKHLRRYFDVNFDMKDIVISSNIFDEYKEYGSGEDFCDFCYYSQDNNDGKLFIDIIQNEQTGEYTLKYAFLDEDCNLDKIMNAIEYMEWDSEDWEKSKYIDDDMKKACKDNIAYLTNEISLLTKDELIDFLNTGI